MLEPQLSHFLMLVRRQFASSDFDAEHPVCMWLSKKYSLDLRQRMWLSFLYMAFYDEASAWAVFNQSDPFTVPKDVNFPIGMNRRNLFGGRILLHFTSLQEIAGRNKEWPYHGFTGNHKTDWAVLKDQISEVWGNGRFAIYTTAEMLQKVAGLPVTITDWDNRNSSGPADGIQRISGCRRKDIQELDLNAEQIYERVLKTGLRPAYTDVDRGVVESCLCNYSGCTRGKFYSGRNVDRQQARIIRVEQMGHALPDLWEARKAVMNHRYLGELNGWVGIDKERLQHYEKTGVMLWGHENRGR